MATAEYISEEQNQVADRRGRGDPQQAREDACGVASDTCGAGGAGKVGAGGDTTLGPWRMGAGRESA